MGVFPVSGEEVEISISKRFLGTINVPDRVHLDVWMPHKWTIGPIPPLNIYPHGTCTKKMLEHLQKLCQGGVELKMLRDGCVSLVLLFATPC